LFKTENCQPKENQTITANKSN